MGEATSSSCTFKKVIPDMMTQEGGVNISLAFRSLSPHPRKGQLCGSPQLPGPEEDPEEPI